MCAESATAASVEETCQRGVRPPVTILIDTYNSGHLIHHAVGSALAQDYPPSLLEILVIDDGSTDDTASVVQRYGASVNYVYKPNGGQASAINCGLRLARGDIICLLDGDDVAYPDRVRRVVEGFQANPQAGILYGEFDILNAEGHRVERSYRPPHLSGDLSARTLLGYGSYGWVNSCIALRKSAIGNIEIPEEPFRLYVDYFLLSIVPLVTQVAVVDVPVGAWVLHGRNHVYGSLAQFAASANVAVQQYAEEKLGRRFVTYMGRGDQGVGLRVYGRQGSRLGLFLREMQQVATARVDVSLKTRAALKLMASFLLPEKHFTRLNSARSRVQAVAGRVLAQKTGARNR